MSQGEPSELSAKWNEILLLVKGEKFAVTTKRIPTKEIIASVGAGILELPQNQGDKIRYEIDMALKKAVLPKCNLTVELRAFQDLREDMLIVIIPADKESSNDYQRKTWIYLTGPMKNHCSG